MAKKVSQFARIKGKRKKLAVHRPALESPGEVDENKDEPRAFKRKGSRGKAGRRKAGAVKRTAKRRSRR